MLLTFDDMFAPVGPFAGGVEQMHAQTQAKKAETSLKTDLTNLRAKFEALKFAV